VKNIISGVRVQALDKLETRRGTRDYALQPSQNHRRLLRSIGWIELGFACSEESL